MDKLKMQSKNKIDENIERIGAMFPNCLTEVIGADGGVQTAIDFEMLKQELSSVVVEGEEERYQFTWPDKKKSILLANSPINKTLRPCREESVDFDSTQNLYIEGDNLDVLKLLQETYMGKVKMIYIDPPYNTGNDFVYEDDFAMSSAEYMEISNQTDEEGNRLFQNNESNGRFHTDWLNMIYPRLKVAKDLLTDDGVIFISIDDNEVENLKKVCDEVFGDGNFVAQLIWKSKGSGAFDAKTININHEYILLYCKNFGKVVFNKKKYNTAEDSAYKLQDERFEVAGKYKRQALAMGTLSYSKTLDYPVICPDGTSIYPGGQFGKPYIWRYSEQTLHKAIEENFIDFVNTKSGWSIYTKQYEKMDNTGNIIERDMPFNTTELDIIIRVGTKEIKQLFNEKIFDYPKPIGVIKFLMQLISSNQEDIVLDFFSGSATTAHAVMQLNAEDGGNRKFICVQLPEETDEKSEAFKAGYKNICEIGKERIRRAGKKIKEQMTNDKSQMTNNKGQMINNLSSVNCHLSSDNNLSSDFGFRVLKLDSSNMKDVYYRPDQLSQDMFQELEGNIKPDRTPEDLLFQVMLDMGVMLDSKITCVQMTNDKGQMTNNLSSVNCHLSSEKRCLIYIVGDYGDNIQPNLVCCFDENLTDEIVTAIAKLNPLYAIFRDSSFSSDSTATNFDQIFETYSKDTVRKVI